MKRIVNFFIQGLLVFTPLALSIYLIYLGISMIDGWCSIFIRKIIGINIPGVGIVILFLTITLMGFFAQSILARPVVLLFNRIISKTPILNSVYKFIRDVSNALMGRDKMFSHPVLVKVNLVSDLEKMGFITEDDLSNFGIKDKVAVFFPHSYNVSGELFIVPTSQITPLQAPGVETLKFVSSGGMVHYDTKEGNLPKDSNKESQH